MWRNPDDSMSFQKSAVITGRRSSRDASNDLDVAHRNDQEAWCSKWSNMETLFTLRAVSAHRAIQKRSHSAGRWLGPVSSGDGFSGQKNLYFGPDSAQVLEINHGGENDTSS